MKKVLLDTNFLLIPGKYKVDVFEELKRLLNGSYELCVLDKTINEMERLKEKLKGKEKEALNIGFQLLKEKDLKIIPVRNEYKTYVDELILALADQEYIICTQDKELKQKLKEKGIKIITMKQKTHLEVI